MPRPARPFRTCRSVARAVAVFVAVSLLVSLPLPAASPLPARGSSGMVVSPEAHATRIGVETLRAGGNAVDAAVAVAFALSVTYPRAGSIGGGGFLLYRNQKGGHEALDFRENAPRLLEPESFLDDAGRPVTARTMTGGLAVGVPGLVAGLAEAHRLWGSRPWRELMRPAIRLADSGFEISQPTATTLEEASKELAASQAARAIFFRDGKTLRRGDRLIQRDLARTLRRIAENGPRSFYQGSIATAIAASVRQAGGVMTVADLGDYRVIARSPIEGAYRGHRIVTFPPPSSGGIVLLQTLGMLERYDLKASGAGSSLSIHRMVEAERRAFADRSRWLGDPEFVRVPVRGLLDPAYLSARASTIRDDVATTSATIEPGAPAVVEGPHTLHFSVTDREGAAIALTTTLNSLYGARLVAADTGVLLNNEMDDFALARETPNQFGLVGEDANRVAPGKRPLSSMAPTIVEAQGAQGRSGRPVLVLGSTGGPTIISAVLEIIVNVVDHGMNVKEAVDAARFHHQWIPDRIDHEKRAFPEDVARALRARGHALNEREPIGNAMVIGLDADGVYAGAADPRVEGLALGF